MDHRIIDLHVHSTESDGTLTPKDLVAEAKKAGLAAFALTDHDTCQGVCKAMPLAASAGIELIPGIELSTDYHGKEVHIVGLYIDIENEQLLKKTAEYRKCRSERNALLFHRKSDSEYHARSHLAHQQTVFLRRMIFLPVATSCISHTGKCIL